MLSISLAGGGALLLAVAGLLGVIGLLKNDGRIAGLLAVLTFGAFASMFLKLLDNSH